MGTARAATEELPPTAVEDDEIVFRLRDPEHEHEHVTLWCDLELGIELELAEVAGGWELRLPMPDLDCLEYLFDVDGELAPDPGNPELVEGAFGPHSWLGMPGYEPPAWLHEPSLPGERRRLSVADLDVVVWEPEGYAGEPLPLL